jgi:alkylation response protein AidB-like acyl-CoA dehydrogenase
MGFTPTSEQIAIGQTMGALLARHSAPTELRAIITEPTRLRALWQRLAEAGVFSLTQPDGGLGIADATIVFEELGRALAPGPLVWTHLAAALVPGAADGSRIVGGLHRNDGPMVLEHPDLVDDVLVLDAAGVWLVDPATLELVPVRRPLDPLTPAALVRALPNGLRVAEADVAARLEAEGRVLTAALLVGIGAAATELAVEYAKQRQQFGRAIGSFQAIKHLLAAMLARTEVARAATQSAGVHLDDAELADSTAWSVVAARAIAARAATSTTADCIQVHGGIGVTWEAHPHLLAKRAQVLATDFDTAAHLTDEFVRHTATPHPA